jgi:hypothetical protein
MKNDAKKERRKKKMREKEKEKEREGERGITSEIDRKNEEGEKVKKM